MSGPKPIMGYRSRTAAAVALARTGLRPAEIAISINVALPEGEQPMTARRISQLLRNAKTRKGRARQPSEQGVRTIAVPVDLLDALSGDAEARAISVSELVRAIIAAVVKDRIVGAVLDDRQEDLL